jgi:hypothetical protein
VQRRHRVAFFGESLFDELQLNLAEPGLEQLLIAFNIAQMGKQTSTRAWRALSTHLRRAAL